MKTVKELISENAPWHRPWFETSPLVKEVYDSLDPSLLAPVKSALEYFKQHKTYNPGDLIRNINDHKSSSPLTSYYHAHLIHGKVMLVYYHGGEYIILMDLVNHKQLEKPNDSRLARKLDILLPRMIELTKNKMEQAKQTRRKFP